MKNGIYNRKHKLKKNESKLRGFSAVFSGVVFLHKASDLKSPERKDYLTSTREIKSHPFSQILSSFGLKVSATF